MSRPKPLIIAHRGASAFFPENTIDAFRFAAEQGRADMIELDLRFSRDRMPIILHDPHLERTTSGSGLASQSNCRELSLLDAAYHFDPESKQTFPMRGRGVKIPTLEEVLTQLPGFPLAIELKEDSEDLVHETVRLARLYGMEEKIIIGSEYHGVATVLKKNYPELTRFCSRREIAWLMVKKKLGIMARDQEPRAVASVPRKSLGFCFHSKAWIDFLHARGMRAFFWTINDPGTMRLLAQYGADGIVTDDPKLAKEIRF